MEEKIALAMELRQHALDAGLRDESLIYDPILPNLSWQEVSTLVGETVKTIRMLASGAIFQEPAQTMIGLSNLRSTLKHRFPPQIEHLCLGLLAGAGLQYVLANVLDPELMAAWRVLNPMC